MSCSSSKAQNLTANQLKKCVFKISAQQINLTGIKLITHNQSGVKSDKG